MFVEYTGPADQSNPDVALALAAQRDDVETTLPDTRDTAPAGATVRATDTTPASGILEPGRIYDLPQDLARRLVASSQWWQVATTDYSTLSKTKLKALAKERGVAGYTTMDDEQLVAALRGSSGPEQAPASDETSGAAAGGDTAPDAAAAGGVPAAGTADTAGAAPATATTTGGTA